MKRALIFTVFTVFLLTLPCAAGELAGTVPASPVQSDSPIVPPEAVSPQAPVAPADMPPPAVQLSCSSICQSDLQACRNSCRTLACYYACHDAYDTCIAGCN